MLRFETKAENNPLQSNPELSVNINRSLHNSEFEIIEETEEFIVVNKPPHLVVHPTKPSPLPTLLEELQQLLIFEGATGGQLAIITRLDRETSGVVLVAKTSEAAHQFSKAMQQRQFTKTYRAIVWGWPDDDQFTVECPIARQRSVRESAIWVKQAVHESGKPSITQFKVLHRFEKNTSNGSRFSLLECHPLTGRTHQIRVHLQFSGFPIIGDKIYGPDESCYTTFIETGWTDELQKILLLNRQALHASGLTWGEYDWKAPIYEDMASFLPIDID